MTIRSLIRERLVADATITTLIPADRWLASSSVDAEPPARPFAVLRYLGVNPGMSRINQTRLEVWIHDDPGSYKRIDDIIRRVRANLDGVEQASDSGGSTQLIQARWEGDSVDLFDDGYRTNTKSSGFTLTGTGF